MLLSSIVIIRPVHALAANSMWTNPASLTFATNNTAVGYKFNVTTWLNVSTNTNSWQFYLVYNKAHLQALRCDYTGSGKSAWSGASPADTVLPSLGAHNATFDYVLIGEVLKSSVERVGAGSLAWVEFEIIQTPGISQTLASELGLDISGVFNSYAMDKDFNSISLNYGKANYSYTWSPPSTQPWLEVLPSSITSIKPSEFDVQVYIRDLDASWELIGVQFNLTYNPTVLNATSLTTGPFMGDPSWAIHGTYSASSFEDGQVIYGELVLPNSNTGLWDLPQFPHGQGLLATVTFQTLVHQAATFNISAEPVFGQHFLDAEVNYMPYNSPKNCAYTYDPLPEPTIAVTPNLYTAAHVNQHFPIDITINDLAAQWKLVKAGFKLTYDPTVLNILNVTEGNFMNSFDTTTFTVTLGSNYVKVNVSLNSVLGPVYPSGTGTLATILFNATGTPGRCALTLSETNMLDFEAKPVLHEVQSGYYRLHEVLIHPIVWNSVTYNVITTSNASITPVPMLFSNSPGMLNFNITGEAGTIGFVDITIPKVLLNAAPTDWILIVGGQRIYPTVVTNTTHNTLHFEVSLSTKSAFIFGTSAIPEFTLNTLLLAFLAATATSFAAAKITRYRKRDTPAQLTQ
jgi:hypothetical protein